jgi:hypothetical protein
MEEAARGPMYLSAAAGGARVRVGCRDGEDGHAKVVGDRIGRVDGLSQR